MSKYHRLIKSNNLRVARLSEYFASVLRRRHDAAVNKRSVKVSFVLGEF